jgi:acetyl-CoA carboxylase biotin carboxyl carrier protein
MQQNVQSPLPGLFYRRPDPSSPPFVQEGDPVTADQTIGLVEVMKQFVEIKAGANGTLVSFALEDNALVGASDVLAVLEVT